MVYLLRPTATAKNEEDSIIRDENEVLGRFAELAAEQAGVDPSQITRETHRVNVATTGRWSDSPLLMTRADSQRRGFE